MIIIPFPLLFSKYNNNYRIIEYNQQCNYIGSQKTVGFIGGKFEYAIKIRILITTSSLIMWCVRTVRETLAIPQSQNSFEKTWGYLVT